VGYNFLYPVFIMPEMHAGLPSNFNELTDSCDRADKNARKERLLRRMRQWFVSMLVISGVGVTAALLNNTLSFLPDSRATFRTQFERAVQGGTNWLIAHPEGTNSALLYMIANMADISGDHRVRHIVDQYRGNPFRHSQSFWERLVDRTAAVRSPSRQELDSYSGYQRWIGYAIAPDHVPLSEKERTDMFAPNRFMWGSRTHQLFALLLYRERGSNSQALNDLINHLCERIAFEANWDVRVTDLYLQRIAFILAAGRPDLIKPRWVERIIASQKKDGGWITSWYGWGPGPYEYSFRQRATNSHTTVQGVWVLYLLKYRFPTWIEQNYHE